MRNWRIAALIVGLAPALACAQFVEIPLRNDEKAYLSCHTIFNVRSDITSSRHKSVVTVCDWIAPVMIFMQGKAGERGRTNTCWDYASPAEFADIRERIKQQC